MSKDKIFRDPVHGYITVSSDYCEKIIDTIGFQRLRRVEQTSMRSLYPSARHDRFIHSLGTYHLGQLAFAHIKKNSKDDLPEIEPLYWDKLQRSFELACLLHDYGHSPFSHTFEKYYDMPANLKARIIELVNKKTFEKDFEVTKSKEHENVGAILVLTDPLKTVLKVDFSVDPQLIARMIIGCKYRNSTLTIEKRVANCFISLLNGQAIDVDKLDYVCRDKWVSGFSSHSLDIHRLVSSMVIKKDEDSSKYELCYYKNAISEIHGVLDVKEFMGVWIYMHHKIVYDTYLLDKAVNKLSKILVGNVKKKAMSKLFNYKSLLDPQKIGPHKIYLPSDDDIIHLLKSYLNKNKAAQEWFSRNHKLAPVWKSYVEFSNIFEPLTSADASKHGALFNTDHIIKKFLKTKGYKETDYYKKPFEPDVVQILTKEVKVFINSKISNYDSLKLPQKTDDQVLKFFFYLFIPKQLIPIKRELIKLIYDYANT